MRKNLFSFLVLAFVVSLASCGGGGGFESDVRKSARYDCQEQKLEEKAETDEKAQKELEDLRKEKEAFEEKMRDKYKDKKDDPKMAERAMKIMQEEMAKCK